MLYQSARLHRREVARCAVITLLTLFCTATSGCSGSKALVPVKGSVKVKGEPAKGAVVMFHPQGTKDAQTASGVVGDDGTFALSSGMQLGIAPGSYKVTVIWPDQSVQPTEQEKMMGTAEDGPDLLKGKYANPADSSLSVEITSSKLELPPFELEAP